MRRLEDVNKEAAQRVRQEIETHGSQSEALAYRIAKEFHPNCPDLADAFITKTVVTDWRGEGDPTYTVCLWQRGGGYGIESLSLGNEVVVNKHSPEVRFGSSINDYDYAINVLSRVKRVHNDFNFDLHHLQYADMDPEKRARKFARRRVFEAYPEWCPREVEEFIDVEIAGGRELDEIGHSPQ